MSGSLDTHIRVWNAESGQCLHTLKGMYCTCSLHDNYYFCYEYNWLCFAMVLSIIYSCMHVLGVVHVHELREIYCFYCCCCCLGHQSLTSGMELKKNILVSGNADSTVKVNTSS